MTVIWTNEGVLLNGTENAEGCLVWPTANIRGYARTSIRGDIWLVHRFVWTIQRGPIPAGLTIDHLCHNRAVAEGLCKGGPTCEHRRCINIDHLAVVDRVENWRRGNQGIPAIRRAKTHCPQGHPYDERNTHVNRSTGARRCRMCHRDSERVRRQALDN